MSDRIARSTGAEAAKEMILSKLDRHNLWDWIAGEAAQRMTCTVLGSDEPCTDDITVDDLKTFLLDRVKNRQVTARRIREILASYGAATTDALPPSKLRAVKEQVEATAGTNYGKTPAQDKPDGG